MTELVFRGTKWPLSRGTHVSRQIARGPQEQKNPSGPKSRFWPTVQSQERVSFSRLYGARYPF